MPVCFIAFVSWALSARIACRCTCQKSETNLQEKCSPFLCFIGMHSRCINCSNVWKYISELSGLISLLWHRKCNHVEVTGIMLLPFIEVCKSFFFFARCNRQCHDVINCYREFRALHFNLSKLTHAFCTVVKNVNLLNIQSVTQS